MKKLAVALLAAVMVCLGLSLASPATAADPTAYVSGAGYHAVTATCTVFEDQYSRDWQYCAHVGVVVTVASNGSTFKIVDWSSLQCSNDNTGVVQKCPNNTSWTNYGNVNGAHQTNQYWSCLCSNPPATNNSYSSGVDPASYNLIYTVFLPSGHSPVTEGSLIGRILDPTFNNVAGYDSDDINTTPYSVTLAN